MNALEKKTAWQALFLAPLLIGVAPVEGGAPWMVLAPTLLAQPSAPAPDIDVPTLLAQARKSLEKGDIATADALVTRAETAKVRYPLFYFGETPASLRREVERARKSTSIGQVVQPRGDQPPTLNPTPLSPVGRYGGAPGTETTPTPKAPTPAPFELESGAKPRALPSVANLAAHSDAKAESLRLMAASRKALAESNLPLAEKLASQASQLNVPESQYGEKEDRPSRLAWDLQRARFEAESGVFTAESLQPSSGTRYGAASALHVAEQDRTHNTPATLVGPSGGVRLAQAPGIPMPLPLAPSGVELSAAELIEQGEQALRQGNRLLAKRRFEQASARSDALNPVERERVENHLKILGSDVPATPLGNDSLLDAASDAQQVLARQLSSDVGKRQLEARRIRESDPREALKLLQSTRKEIEESKLAEQYRGQFLRRVDLAIGEMETFIENNRSQIELDEQNAAVLEEIDRSNAAKLRLQEKIAELVDQFNKFIDEQRYSEAEIVAQRLYELAPHEPVARQVWLNAKMIRREFLNQEMLDRKDEALWAMEYDNLNSSFPNVGDKHEMEFDAQRWEDFVLKRSGLSEGRARRTQRDLEIQKKLKTPVQLRYENRPLSEVIDGLSQMTGVNIHLDPRGMAQEGVSTDNPVTIDLNTEVMLKSALNLILEPLHLSYVIKDEVLKVTSKQLRDGEIYPQTYYVADLVTPIPNFVPSNNIGLQGLINDAHAALGYGAGGVGAPGPMAFVNHKPQFGPDGQPLSEEVLAAPAGSGGMGGFGAGGASVPLGTGPGGMGGGANADFDTLIDLIISTVASESWAENGGGEAEIRPYFNNLSLVISQTQAVHEEIEDLLEQLRRLQDLQITIEVRFIRLNDSFFERIGIDFDVNINDNTNGTADLIPGQPYETPRRSATVGINQPVAENLNPSFTSDLDLPFRQGSFPVAVPQFGGFDPGSAATFGFAILSDIEAYFLISAAQGDERTNVLNAPKVTLFNGQTAFVADTSQTPFVISVIPVVGEFAAAQQPVIVVLSEGTLMNIQAVVSDDRRYVRLTVVPFFSEIGDVEQFTFEGSTSTSNSSSSSSTTDEDNVTDSSDSSADDVIRSGTTVQLPTFSFVSVSTTVSVPDGGTVLLGGIKRLSEGRNEVGVPLLSKIPFVNRLFRNVGIGRETDSLMMMVTPRIIIQEEEEAKLGL